MRFLAVLFLLPIFLTGCGTPKDQWLTVTKAAMPLTICEQDYFELCFKWTGKVCRKEAKKHTNVCGEEIRSQLPKTIGPIAGTEWGEKLGRCIGGKLAEENLKIFQLTKQCEKSIVELMGEEMLQQIRKEVKSGAYGTIAK